MKNIKECVVEENKYYGYLKDYLEKCIILAIDEILEIVPNGTRIEIGDKEYYIYNKFLSRSVCLIHPSGKFYRMLNIRKVCLEQKLIFLKNYKKIINQYYKSIKDRNNNIEKSIQTFYQIFIYGKEIK